MIRAMIVLRLGLVAVVGLASCVESRRRPAAEVTGDADATVGDAAEDAADGVTADGVDDAADAVPQCTDDSGCAQPATACREAVCDSGACVVRDSAPGAECDDGNPCTGAGRCVMQDEPCPASGCSLSCAAGEAVVDGTDCDADQLVCNGANACEGGICVVALAPVCEASGRSCVAGAECSEEAGRCVDLPGEDGVSCAGPPGAPGESWLCSVGRCVPFGMVAVDGGIYTIGCPDTTGGNCKDDNVPAHEVRLSSFAIDLLEVSEGEFRRCRDDEDQRGMSCSVRAVEGREDVVTQSDAMPLRWVDWLGAYELCAYQGKRLCTEAEWEVAARGDGSGFFPWGNLAATCDKATFNRDGAGCGTDMPSEVGAKPLGASPYGLLDMAGNVAEWCADYYRRDVYAGQADALVTDPVQGEQAATDSHVVRGGGFRDGFGPIRTFERSAHPSDGSRDDLGVRCCLSLEEL